MISSSLDPSMEDLEAYATSFKRNQQHGALLWHPDILLSQAHFGNIVPLSSRPLAARPLYDAEALAYSGVPFNLGTTADSACDFTNPDSPASRRPKGSQDKNRQAQKRYRERQKEKLEHYERQVAELSGKVEELMRDKVSLESRNSLLEKVVKLKDETRADTTNAPVSEPPGHTTLMASMADLYNLMFDGRRHFTVEDVRRMFGTGEVWEMQKEYTNQLMLCLVDAEKDSLSPAAKRLAQLVSRYRTVAFRLLNMDAKIFTSVSSQCRKWYPDQATWRSVAAVLDLTDVQKARLVNARRLLLNSMAELIEKRKAILARLQSSLCSPDQFKVDGPGFKNFESGHAAQLQLAINASEELQKSLEHENRAVSLFSHEFYSEDLFTPLQYARLMVAAAPCSVDSITIVNLLAADGETGESPTDLLMGQMAEALQGNNGKPSLLPADSPFRALLANNPYVASAQFSEQ